MKKIYSSLLLLLLINLKINAQNYKSKDVERPNIIFILTDDQRWDALGYAGNEIIQTPEMDKLAKAGTYFKNALVTTPICAGSRASILTGLHERTHGYDFTAGFVREEYMSKAYPKLLKEAGYHTGFFGKFGVRYEGLKKLFHEYESYDRNGKFKDRRGYYYKKLNGETVHLTRYTGQKALDFINNVNTNKPFCLSLSFSAPHAHDSAEEQYFWQQQNNSLFENETMPEAALSTDEYFNALPDAVREGFNRTRWYWRYDTPEKYQHSVKGYYRMIAGIDQEITKIRKKLKEKKLDENTVIILLGDNGYFLGERQLAGKWLMYDNSIRVPLIIYDPRVKKHGDIDKMALNIDVPATILDMAGVNVPENYHGKSLLPVVQSKGIIPERDTVLIEHLWDFEHIPPSEGVRTTQWKYLRYIDDKSIEELYNLNEDPLEIKNLAKDASYRKTLSAFRNKCDALTQKYKDPFSGVAQDLMIEFIREPTQVKIKDATPEFTWALPKEIKEQNAYQLLVASTKENIDNNIGDKWNSKKVWTSNTINIPYNGMPLEVGKTYFWKVRFWDDINRTGAYSPSQQFTMGEEDSLLTSSNIFQIDRIKPKVFTKRNEGNYFIDFGKDAFATIELNYETTQADSITIRLGEELLEGKINKNPQGHIRYQEVKLYVSPNQKKYLLQLPPDKRNTKEVAIALPDSFPVLMPFRYVEIESANNGLKADDITQLAYHIYFDEEQSHFSSSDSILNQIWEMCKYTMKATSFAGLYVDGDRERIPYEADAYIQQLGHYAVDKEYPIARETIEYFMEYPTWPTEWQQHVALLFYQDYMYTGNTELIAHYYESLKHKTLMELVREDGLISSQSEKMTPAFMRKLGFKDSKAKLRDIVDWPPAQKDTGWQLATEEGERDGFVFMPINTVINCLYYQNMKIMAEFAKVLNKPEEVLDFELRAAKAKYAINSKLFDKEKGAYVDGEGTDHSSVHANMMAMAFDIVPKIYKDTVMAFIKTRGMACSVYGAQFLMEAVYNGYDGDYALELMTATHNRSWYNMIKVGATMAMEAWDMKYKPNADWNHAWGAVPANIIPRGLWGIRPLEPGFGVVQIKPQMGSLENCTIAIPTLRGQIKGKYQKINNKIQRYTIELPAGVYSEFIPPKIENLSVYLNGKKANLNFGTVRLQPGENIVEVKARVSLF